MRALVFVVALLARPLAAAQAPSAVAPLPVGVVVITAMESEMARFAARLPLGERLAFPAGCGGDLYWNASLRVIGLETNEGVRRATASVMALGYDERFDLREAFFLFAGIAGADPAFASVGSAIWTTHIVHAEQGYLLDPREVSFDAVVVPEGRTRPFQRPAPKGDDMVFDLTALAEYAYERTARSVTLEDTPNLQATRAAYHRSSPAAQPPSVLLGDTVSGDFFWAGSYWTEFYRRWARYWIGRAADDGEEPRANAFATTAMEDTAIATALASLARAARANASRLLVLRTVSDYSQQPPATDLVQWLFGDTHMSAEDEAYEAAWRVASPVILDLCCGPGFSSPFLPASNLTTGLSSSSSS